MKKTQNQKGQSQVSRPYTHGRQSQRVVVRREKRVEEIEAEKENTIEKLQDFLLKDDLQREVLKLLLKVDPSKHYGLVIK
jgi:hypothetical protein